MFGPAAAYVVVILAMSFAATSALTLFYAVRHFDPSQESAAKERRNLEVQGHIHHEVAV